MSRWRSHANRVIDATLNALPDGATLADARKALRDAYPFGERAMTPYHKVWCNAVSLHLRQRFGRETAQKPIQVVIDVKPADPLPLAVHCGWCKLWAFPGCIACCRLRKDVASLLASEDWQKWRPALLEDPAAALAFADYLEDKGVAWEIVDAVRRHGAGAEAEA